jgi:hypothetical protein
LPRRDAHATETAPAQARGPAIERKSAAEASPQAVPAREPDGTANDFILRHVRPWPPEKPEFALAVSNEQSQRVSSYDNALLALYLMRSGQRPLAGKILAGLATLQRSDGTLPFSFAWPAPDPHELYVRTGAVAWVGYAAVEYLDSEPGGAARAKVVGLAHRLAQYLLDRQVSRPGDTRDGLVLGGYGSYRVELQGGEVREVYAPGEVDWASTEHNIDSYFFLRDFARVTQAKRFEVGADRIRSALLSRGFMPDAGQFVQGFDASRRDVALALDCASWAGLFLLAAGDEALAAVAVRSADTHFASRERQSGVLGHRPYAHAKVVADPKVAARVRAQLPSNQWDAVAGVWPEGSAGVALAQLRLGNRRRAEQILEQLDRMRTKQGGLPTFSMAIPYVFDAEPSLAGTLWVELVRDEFKREDLREMLWRRH